MPSAGYQQINLVGYQPGMARYTDANLNGWGTDYAPDGAFCVANTSTRTATFYNAQGRAQSTVITIPAAAGLEGLPLGPTGVVYNPTSDFVISAHGKSAPATFIFDTLDGLICGWNPALDPNNAIVMVDNSAELPFAASYTALALTTSHGKNVLYACDSGADTIDTNDRIDMLDGHFHTFGSFTDPKVDPQTDGTIFQVEDVGDKLFVTFTGFVAPYGGVVDVFSVGDVLDTKDGPPTPHRFAYNAPGQGPLVAPWGITTAPADFGKFSNDLLIGNVEGDGNINAFDPHTGKFLGQLKQPDGTPIAIPGLWDLKFGGGTRNNGRTDDLYFTAGFTGENPTGNGLFGVIRAAEGSEHQGQGQGQSSEFGDPAGMALLLAGGPSWNNQPPAQPAAHSASTSELEVHAWASDLAAFSALQGVNAQEGIGPESSWHRQLTMYYGDGLSADRLILELLAGDEYFACLAASPA